MEINIVLLILITVAAAFVQGFCGFGYGILTMAFLSFIVTDMERASVFASLSVLPLLILLMIRSRRSFKIDWKQGLLISIGVLAGSPLGYCFIYKYGSMPIFRFVFGIALIFFAAYKLSKPHIRRSIPNAYAPLFGFVCGLLSGAFSSGGPPVILYLYAQEDDPRKAVGTVQLVFLFGGFYRLFIVEVFGRGISLELTLKAVWVMPGILVLTFLAHALASRSSHQVLLRTVNIMIMFAGIANVIKSLPF